MATLDLTLLRKDKAELRDYQVMAAGNALTEKRVLVVMPTALGKTIIAIMVACHLLKQSKKILFLAPTKPLALQQANRFKETVDIPEDRIATVTGEVKPEEREKLYAQALVVCGTPQTITHDVLARKIVLADYELIVFDEAHRAVGDYAYVFLGKQAQNTNAHILGLTASPSSQKEKILEICGNLGVKHIELKTEKDEDVASYVKQVKVEWEFVDMPAELMEVKKRLQELLRDALDGLKEASFLPSADVNKVNKRDLLMLRPKILFATKTDPRAYSSLSILAKAMNLTHAIDLVESQGIQSLASFMANMRQREAKTKAVRALLNDFRFKIIEEKAKEIMASGAEHPKVRKLKEIVSAHASETIIVFAHYRDSVAFLVNELNKIQGINAKPFTGRAAGGMTQKQQAKVLDEFRAKEFNVLISTSVAEEGIDVPAVDLVIFFEAVPSEIRLIQRRGRAGRAKVGKAIVLVTKNSKDEAFLWISRRKERMMKENIATVSRELKKGEEQKTIEEFQ